MEAPEFANKNGEEWFVGVDATTGQSIVYGRDGKTMAWCCDEEMARLVAQLPPLLTSVVYTNAFLQRSVPERFQAMLQQNEKITNALTSISAAAMETQQKRRA